MVQFKTLLPWAIIYTMFVIGISFWAGWYYHGGYAVDIESKASAKADAIVTGLKAVK
jgi:predicted negative regulator of RcsB-dependent stress response